VEQMVARPVDQLLDRRLVNCPRHLSRANRSGSDECCGARNIQCINTSRVLSLARTSRLEFLRVLYQQLLIPSAVYEELGASSSQPPGPPNADATGVCAFWCIFSASEDSCDDKAPGFEPLRGLGVHAE
jgi:hypothetical protein